MTGGSTAKLDSGGTAEAGSAGMEGDADRELTATEGCGVAAGADGGAAGVLAT